MARKKKEEPYSDLLDELQRNVMAAEEPLFRTDARHLFAKYLAALPPSRRKEHTCSACHRFVSRYGGLVSVLPSGRTKPIMWQGGKGVYAKAFSALRSAVEKAAITGVFKDARSEWGVEESGGFRHMSAMPGSRLIHADLLKTAGQAAAEKREEMRAVRSALSYYTPMAISRALSMLRNGDLSRPEKALPAAAWFAETFDAWKEASPGRRRYNVLWLRTATAPAGFCHVRSSILGSLLEDIDAGLSDAECKARFDAKLDPTMYQRPQAAPTEGNVRRAEEVVRTLGTAGALRRRRATLLDAKLLWQPSKNVRTAGSDLPVFGSLLMASYPKGLRPVPKPITWSKFERDVLPHAERLRCAVREVDSFVGLTTAVDPDAPPILQWDLPGKRNPVAWYCYVGGSPAHQWRMTGGRYAEVAAVCLLPSMWDGAGKNQGKSAILLLEGCADTLRVGSCLFPETLKAEYREIRASIEAWSAAHPLEDAAGEHACGLDLREGGPGFGRVVEAVSGGEGIRFLIDRWD
jgi:hypothetical protein